MLSITGKHRNAEINLLLGRVLAIVAGAVNAGGFFIVQQYTSHMTGIISLAADKLALGESLIALLMFGFLLSFIVGAAITTLITVEARAHHLHSQYALPLVLEALLLILIALLWNGEPHDAQAGMISNPIGQAYMWVGLPAGNIMLLIALLSFIMGIQNALITKASSAVIRTTHITGMSTDLGIELGRALTRKKGENIIDYRNAKRHASLILAFFSGGILGAFGVQKVGIHAFLLLAFFLLLITLPQLWRDALFLRSYLRRKKATADLQ